MAIDQTAASLIFCKPSRRNGNTRHDLACKGTQLVGKLHVFFLDKGGIHKHHRAEIAGGRGADDIAAKAPFDQAGNVAGMVEWAWGPVTGARQVGKSTLLAQLLPLAPGRPLGSPMACYKA